MLGYLKSIGFSHKKGFSSQHYRALFDLAYKLFEEKVNQGIDAEIAVKCKKSTKACEVVRKFKSAIGSDDLLLARPADVHKLYGGKGYNIGLVQEAQAIISSSLVHRESTINLNVISRLANNLISNIGMVGGGKNITKLWSDFGENTYDPKSPMMQSEQENKAEADAMAAKTSTWADADTILLGSAVMWMLAREATPEF
jgi:hypothetical protein